MTEPAGSATAQVGSDTDRGAGRDAGGPLDPGARQRWRAVRAPLLFGLALLLVAVVTVLANRPPATGYLDPRAPNGEGSRAVAELLADRGVPVQRVTTVQAARRATDPGELFVLTRSELLDRSQLDTLARASGHRLLVAPSKAALDALAPGVSRTGTVPTRVRGPGCDLQAAQLAGNAHLGGGLYQTGGGNGTGGAGTGCYPARQAHSLLRVASGGHATTVIGTGQPFLNDQLGEAGNAALAMNLLGARPSVVWLVPDPVAVGSEGGGEGQQPLALLPDVVPLAAAQLLVAVLLVALWRGRRLGPAVPERLPVTVRAAEAVEGRGRLYRSRRARDRAAAALREGCRARLAPRVGLPSDADPGALSDALAARSRRSEQSVGALLYGPTPGSDAALVRLADDLDALEREVRRS